MNKLIRSFGKPVCVLLYGAFAALAAKKKPIPLLALFATHAAEYVLIGRKVAREQGIPAAEGLAQCLAFGFTWWLPVRQDGR